MKHKLIIAHRGGENSFLGLDTFHCFEKAISSGADIVEFDVRRTKDNVYIVIHDSIIRGKKIDTLTFEHIYKYLNGNILKLEDVLRISKDRIKIYIELKEEGYEIDMINIVRKYLNIDKYAIISFNDSSIKNIKDSYPEIQVGLILGKPIYDNSLLLKLSELFPVKRIINSKADIVLPNWKLVKFGILPQIKSCNKPVMVWTLNNIKLMRRFLHNKRVDGIITDNIRMAVSIRKAN